MSGPNMPRDEMVEKDRHISMVWRIWFRSLLDSVDAAPASMAHKSLNAQEASIGSSALPVTISTGLYRLSYQVRVTRPATTSSSIQVTLTWTDGGVLCSYSGAALVGNLTTSLQSGSVLVRATAATALNYSTTYASVGGVTMQYELDIVVERIDA